MEIAAATQTIPQPQAKSDAAVINSDFETFLRMLTAQMENQDPLDPLDAQDFATQLATFSGVEQQVKTNDLLSALSSQMVTASLGDMASWVGKDARIAGAASFNGTPIELYPTPPALSDRAELLVKDAKGEIVQRIAAPLTDEPITWAGVGEGGQPLPAGQYSFAMVGYSNDQLVGETIPHSFSRIAEVRNDGGDLVVVTSGGDTFPASAVTGLR